MVVFQFANDIRADKKVCYTLSRCPHRLAAKDATLSRWISRVRIPLGAPQNLRSPLPIRWRAFCCPYAGIRTRQGAELRKREAFSSAARKERSDAAEAGGASRTRTSRWGHHSIQEARHPRGDGLFATHAPEFEPDRTRSRGNAFCCAPTSDYLVPKAIRYLRRPHRRTLLGNSSVSISRDVGKLSYQSHVLKYYPNFKIAVSSEGAGKQHIPSTRTLHTA